MDNRSTPDKILSIERKIDVNQFTYKGIAIWPVIRISMYLTSKSTATHSHTGVLSKIRFMLSGLKESLRFYFFPLPGIPSVFLSSSHYKVVENGQKHDRIIEPFLQWMDEKKNDYAVFEFTSQYKNDNDLLYRSRMIKMQAVIYLMSLLWRVQYRFADKGEITGDIKKLNTLLSEHNISFKINGSFLWRLYFLKKQSDLFELFLRKSGTKNVLMVCYYDFKSLALVWATRRLNLKSIDLQHGVQGPKHLAYSQWPAGLANSSPFLPTHFWVWDESSADSIAEWKVPRENIILGNNKWFADRVTISTGEIILFTVQPIADGLPDILCKTIREYKGNRKWFIRLHPQQLSELPAYRDRLNTAGISDKVNLEEASRLPLTEILKRTYLHITFFSSVAIEAAYFQVPTIFLDERGKEVFQNSLPGELLITTGNGEDLGDVITSFENTALSTRISAPQNSASSFHNINKFFS